MSNSISLVIPELRKEVALRLERLCVLMRQLEMEAMLIASNANIYYAAGRFFRGYVYITVEGKAVYFVIRPNDFAEAPDVVMIRKPEQIPDELGNLGLEIPSTVGLELDALPYSDIMRLQKVFHNSSISNASPLLRQARQVKTDFEIDLMKEDGLHQAAVYHKITCLYKRDMTDLEFQIEIERVLRLEGSLGFLRVSGPLMEINMGSVIAGDNADTPSPYDFAMGGSGVNPTLPGGANGEIMRVGQTVMVDVNGCFNGYQTDMTRVWRLGDVNETAIRAHECSRRILHELEKTALPGVEVSQLYLRAEAIVNEEGLSKYFMGHRQQAPFIGHGVGIELNETPAITPKSKDKLKENMTLAIEPKFVVPGVGAVGIENTYVVRRDGLECITPFPEEMQNLL